MNIAFVNLPIIRHDVEDLAPPLGILCLIDAISTLGISISFIDLNLASARWKSGNGDFYQFAINEILKTEPAVVAISSMCINSHIGIELCERIKKLNKRIKFIFGGAHYSSISDSLYTLYSVDTVIKGEGEEQLYNFLNVSNYVKRKRNGFRKKLRNPWEAFNYLRLDEYFRINKDRLINLEAGRGCKYKCKFCYSHSYWKSVVTYPVSAVAADFQEANERGVRRIFIVNDNFLNNNRCVSELCNELIANKNPIKWSCYLSIPDINKKVPELLANAGCDSAYLGVDSSTAFQNKHIGKSYLLNKTKTNAAILSLIDRGIVPTCALIIDPFSWSMAEVETALQRALQLRLLGAEISLHLYTQYMGTESYPSKKGLNLTSYYDEFRARIMFDSIEEVYKNRYARDYPGLFPFHSRTVHDCSEYERGILLIHAAQNIISHYPYELRDISRLQNKTIVSVLYSLFSKMGNKLLCKEGKRNFKALERYQFEEMLLTDYGFASIL